LHEDAYSGESWITIPLIQAETGLTRNAIDDARAWLKKHGWLVFTGWYRRNIPKYRTTIGTVPKTHEKRGGNTRPTPKIGVGHTKAATPNNGVGQTRPTPESTRDQPQSASRPTPEIGVLPTPKNGVRKENHKVDIEEEPEGEGVPGAKDVLSNPNSPVKPGKDQLLDNNTIPPLGKEEDLKRRNGTTTPAQSLDEAMALYRESNPAYAKLANSLIPDEESKALDDVILSEAVQVAVAICNTLGESVGTKDNPQPVWATFYVRLKAACGPTVTVPQIYATVKQLTDRGVKIHPGLSAVDFANLANAPEPDNDEPVKECVHCWCVTGPAAGEWKCFLCEQWNTGEATQSAETGVTA